MNNKIIIGLLIVFVVVGGVFIVKNIIEDNKREKQFELESERFFGEVKKIWIPENYTFNPPGHGGTGDDFNLSIPIIGGAGGVGPSLEDSHWLYPGNGQGSFVNDGGEE